VIDSSLLKALGWSDALIERMEQQAELIMPNSAEAFALPPVLGANGLLDLAQQPFSSAEASTAHTMIVRESSAV